MKKNKNNDKQQLRNNMFVACLVFILLALLSYEYDSATLSFLSALPAIYLIFSFFMLVLG